MSFSTFRAFLGLPLPAPIRANLSAAQAPFREAGVRASWVPEENFHLTLCFLGNISHDDVVALDEAVSDSLAEHDALQLALGGIGAFPSARRPAVVWNGVEVLQGNPAGLYETLSAVVADFGIPLERRAFQPHVTLFRMRRGHGTGAVTRCLERASAPASDAFWVDNVALWRSELRRGGAAYHVLKEYPLKCLPSTSSYP